MIQRKQTLYLLFAAIVAIVFFVMRMQWIDVLQLATAALCVYDIFLYKRRMLQARLCLLGMFLVLVWYVCKAAIEGTLEPLDSMPMIEAILLVLARNGIISDEKLVRAADRIR